MDTTCLKQYRRSRRHHHIRKHLIGTTERPRLNVFRSNINIYCQIIDDTVVNKQGCRCGATLVACSTLNEAVKSQLNGKHGGNIKAAQLVGAEIAKLAKEKGITAVAFDRGGYKYHGRIKALADAARKGGLQF